MAHLKHNSTGEWKFNAGAGWSVEWEFQSGAAADLEYAKHVRVEGMRSRVKSLIESRYDEPEQRSLIKIILEAKIDGKVNRFAYADAAWTWVLNMQTIYYDAKDAVAAAVDQAALDAVADPNYTATMAADPFVEIRTALGVPD